jgi:hypothetical protein
MNTPITSKLMTVRETARTYGLPESSIYDLARGPWREFVVRLGRRVLIDRAELEAFFLAHRGAGEQ